MSALATFTVLATEAHEEASGLDLVLPDFAELLWGAVCFFILLLLVWKKALPALNKTLEERATTIQGQQEAASKEREEAEQLKRQYEQQLADARGQATGVIDEARQQAERVRSETIARAEQEAQQIVQRAREEAEAERGRLIVDLRGQVATLSVDLASKIVQRELDPAQHRDLVDQYINELSGLN